MTNPSTDFIVDSLFYVFKLVWSAGVFESLVIKDFLIMNDIFKQDKSAARFFRQVAAWVPDMFSIFYLVKSHKIANNSATTEDREKKHRLRILRITEMF
jgi:hypothetical protein